MLERYSFKCSEKAPWKRFRQWRRFLVLCLTTLTMLLLYYLSPPLSLPMNSWMTNSWKSQQHNNMPHSTIPPADPSDSKYFVPYPHKYNFILDEHDKCQQESPFLVIIVPVSPDNRKARSIIRHTWSKDVKVLGLTVSYYFLLGLPKQEDETGILNKKVQQESQRFHDIIQSDFLDSYNNLTIKTMVMFEWLSSHCPNSYYAMKVDTDMFLNVHKLVSMILKAPRHLYMTGLVFRDAIVHRDPTSKWFLPRSAFSESTFPPYALGFSYVFSLDLPKKIVAASAHVKAIYIEDVYVGLCMKHLGIPLTDPPHGDLFRIVMPILKNKCYWTSVITTVLLNSSQLLDIWEKYQAQAQSCT